MVHKDFTPESVRAAALSGLGMVFSTGPIVLATFSLFMLPMAKEFGWGRGQISLALVLSSGCAALADPIAGRLADRYGVRRIVIPGIVVFGLANAALGLVSHSLALLYVAFALVGLSSVTCGAVPYSKIITGWFAEKRGLVLGLALGVGAGAGSAIISQLTRFLIDHAGWRDARFILGGLILAMPFPLMSLFLRESHSGQSRSRRPSVGITAAEARRQPTFYLMFAMIFVGTTALAGAVVHMVAMLSDKGLSLKLATVIYSTCSMANIGGRILTGWLQDRIGSARVGVPVYLTCLAGLSLLAFGSGFAAMELGAILLGLGFGAEVVLAGYWVSRYWGLREYGQIYGFIYAAASAGAAVGPFVMGWVFDMTGSYRQALLAFQVAIGLCLAANLFLGPYVYAARQPAPKDAELEALTESQTA